MTEVHLSRFGRALGEPRRLDDIDDADLRQELPNLRAGGLDRCLVTDRPLAELAAESARQTVAAGPAVTVQAVVYCTDTPADLTITADLWEFLLAARLPDVPGMVVGGSGCGNLGPGLRTARDLITSEGLSTVLLVTVDRVKTGTRYLDNGQTALSDGAASCLVTAEADGAAYTVRGIDSRARVGMGRVADSPITVARTTAEAIRESVRRATEPAGLGCQAFRHVLLGNYASSALSFLAMSAGVKRDRVYAPAAAERGHCFSADALLDLATLADSADDLADGEHTLIISTSPRSWTSVALTRRSAA